MATMQSHCNTEKRKDKVLSRVEIEHLIASGQQIFIVDQNVVKADSWLHRHPGGDKIIQHMVGRDASDEVHAMHCHKTLVRMKAFHIGRIDYVWVNFIPPIQGGKFRLNEEDSTVCGIELHKTDSAKDLQDYDATGQIIHTDTETAHVMVVEPVQELTSETPVDLDAPQMEQMETWTIDEKAFDISKYPDLDPEVQADITQRYRKLEEQIDAAGLYNCNFKMYAIEISRYATLFGLCMLFLHKGWYILSALFLGIFWHQLVFSAHDAGHLAITHNYVIDTAIGVFIADFLGGLSIGWWKRSHNIHHVVTNSPEHDPDVQLMPFFALSQRFFGTLSSTFYDRKMDYDALSKVAVRYQKYLYYPILLFGRFKLYHDSWEHIIKGYGPQKGPGSWVRWGEIAGQIFFWTWFGYGILWCSIPTWFDRVAFVLVSHMATAPLHVQITLSHYAMSTVDVGPAESFPQKMLRTTMDVQCPQWLDFIHGGLQFQAIHHLFPRMPRHNLRQAQGMVQKFCVETGIPYALHGFVDGNKQVIGRLADVGRQAAILAKCQKTIAGQSPLHHHH